MFCGMTASLLSKLFTLAHIYYNETTNSEINQDNYSGTLQTSAKMD